MKGGLACAGRSGGGSCCGLRGGGVGWRGEGGNTHSNESITEVNYNLRSIFCYLDVTFLSN